MEYIDNDWKGKKAFIQILKDRCNLTFTAQNIVVNGNMLSFTDKMGVRYGFPMHCIQEVKEIK